MTRIRSIALLVILIALSGLSLNRLITHRESVVWFLDLGPEYVPRQISAAEAAWFQPLPRENLTPELRNKRATEDSDTYFNPNRIHEPDYRAKVTRHYAIERFLTASRRTDPHYLKVLEVLVSQGYGIEEWAHTCMTILSFGRGTSVKYEPPQKPAHNAHHTAPAATDAHTKKTAYNRAIDGFARTLGTIDPKVIHPLLSISLEYQSGEPLLGLTPVSLERGDRLWTDADWITPEMRRAQAAYQGPDRKLWTGDLRRGFADFLKRSRQRAQGRHVPEDRQTIQDLIGFGLLDPEDLVGVEVVEGEGGGWGTSGSAKSL